MESFPSGQLCQGGDSQLVVEFKVKTGNQVLVTMTPLQIECLASKLVFGTKWSRPKVKYGSDTN